MPKEMLESRMLELLSSRGKKGSKPKELISSMRALATRAHAFGVFFELPVLMLLISMQFDTQRKIDSYMSHKPWRACYEDLRAVMRLLRSNAHVRIAGVDSEDLADVLLAEDVLGKDTAQGGGGADREKLQEKIDRFNADGTIQIYGSLIGLLEQLRTEYIKSLQHIDPHTHEYIARLQDEQSLMELAKEVRWYYELCGELDHAATAAGVVVELVYYKHDKMANAVHVAHAAKQQFGNFADLHPACLGSSAKVDDVSKANTATRHPASFAGKPEPVVELLDSAEEMRQLCRFLYKYGNDRCKIRTMLCHIYHHAIHDRFYEARDFLLMSHLQDIIAHADVSTQILFNRMMAQLGLCAFRNGMLLEAHSCLMEIQSQGRVKELLAQGIQRYSDKYSEKNTEQENAERRRQTPYHMHINLELLECVYLICAMLLEIPNIACEVGDGRRRVISKMFRRYMEYYDRQPFKGPPENSRDHVMAASKCLAKGDWEKCSVLLLSLSVWSLIPDHAGVKAMLQEKIQIEALRTYLLTYSSHYESMSLEQLCSMFQLPEKTLHTVVSKMMIQEELHAAWDQPTGSIVLYKVDPTPVQSVSLQYAEKAALLVESNERLFDAVTGGNVYRDEYRSGKGKGGRFGNRERHFNNPGGGGGRGKGKGKGKDNGGRGRFGDRYKTTNSYGNNSKSRRSEGSQNPANDINRGGRGGGRW